MIYVTISLPRIWIGDSAAGYRGVAWVDISGAMTRSCMPPYAAVCYRLFLLSQPAAATIVPTTIKMISQFVRYEQTQHQHLLTL